MKFFSKLLTTNQNNSVLCTFWDILTNLYRSVKGFGNTNHHWGKENPENIIEKQSYLQVKYKQKNINNLQEKHHS